LLLCPALASRVQTSRSGENDAAFSSGVRRVNLQVFVPNQLAVQLYQSLGFAETGRELEACIQGTYYDGLYMSLAR
jgi:RimJ/RimL family protein N-acetyltransferase